MRIPYFKVTECIQVGEVLFRIDVPCRFPWKKKDSPFLVKEDAEHQREVLVQILFEEELEEPQIPLLMDRGNIKVWADKTLDIRAFYSRKSSLCHEPLGRRPDNYSFQVFYRFLG